MKTGQFPLVWALLLSSLPCIPAPVPRCSPFIIINKLVEWTSLWSDSNGYFPVGPCEYGGPFRALQEGDLNAVFLLDEPEKIPRHNIYEFVWFLKTGMTRMKRMMLGLEPFRADFNILTEGYQHYTPGVRTTQLGHGTERRPELIDDEELWVDFVGGKIRSLFTEGPDLQRTRYTPVGPLRRNQIKRRNVKRLIFPRQVARGEHSRRVSSGAGDHQRKGYFRGGEHSRQVSNHISPSVVDHSRTRKHPTFHAKATSRGKPLPAQDEGEWIPVVNN